MLAIKTPLPLDKILERETGFEPATSSLARKCSTTELLPLEFFLERGAEAQNRTGDTSIFSAVLYQLSYLGNNHILRMC